jgi:hypothetical protein
MPEPPTAPVTTRAYTSEDVERSARNLAANQAAQSAPIGAMG